MEIFNTTSSIQEKIAFLKNTDKSIGFVPTMGALHEGHISLVQEAKKKCKYVIVSIFVNPKQFNNPYDLEKYPRTLEEDLDKLRSVDVDAVFTPSYEDIYPTHYLAPLIDLKNLDQIMEGKFRPGHFKGVVEVVKRLFEIVNPNFAFFGQKDFQQLAIIKYMTSFFNLPIQIVECPTIRSVNGLALSSRNMRLSEKEKNEALIIYQILSFAQQNAHSYSPSELSKICFQMLEKSTLIPEYVEIVDSNSLESLSETWSESATCCIAAYCGEVRLIDNMKISYD